MSASVSSRHEGSKPWLCVFTSVILSAGAVFIVGCFYALLYPILEELRAEKVTEDGAEQNMLGFWSILVLSALVGIISSVFSWTLTYLDSYQPGASLLDTCVSSRDEQTGFHLSYGIAALNGLLAMLTVFWILN